MPLSFPLLAPAIGTSKRTLRILYAEDMHELRELVRICLSREGHDVTCLPDGGAAIEHLATDRAYDMVITDHHMPVMKGLEVVHALRGLGFTGRILVLSSELSPVITSEYESLGVDRILMKPLLPSQLRAVVDEFFPARAA